MKALALLLPLACLLGAAPLRAEAPPESLKAAALLDAIPAEKVKLTLYSISPVRADFPDSPKTGLLHGFPVLGQAAISSAAERRELLSALAGAARACASTETKCFNPRHALRVETAEGTADYVICFQCHLVSAYGAPPLNIFLIGGPPDAFNRALARHGLRKAD